MFQGLTKNVPLYFLCLATLAAGGGGGGGGGGDDVVIR
jgi:hypothetical protein